MGIRLQNQSFFNRKFAPAVQTANRKKARLLIHFNTNISHEQFRVEERYGFS